MKITKRMAEQISEILIRPKFDHIKEARRKFMNELAIEVEKIIPIEVMTAYKKYPGYFRTMTVRFNKGILKPENIQLNNLPVDSYNWQIAEDVLDENSIMFDKLKEIQEVDEKCHQKHDDLKITIMSFSTVAKLEIGFPEAFKVIPDYYINKQNTNLPVKNIESLRNWINKEPKSELLNK